LLSNADELGYDITGSYRYTDLKTRSINITQNIPNLVSFARSNGTTYKVLKTLNPWLRGNSLTMKAGRSYQLVLPE